MANDLDLASIVKAFREIRDVPYQIPLGEGEENRSCAGKHERFQSLLTERGIASRIRVCTFHWSRLSLPSEVLAIPHQDEATHAYLEVCLDDTWQVVDLTWDEQIASVLPLSAWDGRSDTIVAVPVEHVYTPEDSLKLMHPENEEVAIKADLAANGAFYQALNVWLAQIRVYAQKYPRVGIGALVMKDGKMLMGKRKSSHGEGEYASPGGHLEYMESFTDGVRREIREEAGIEVENIRLLTVSNLREHAPKHYVDLCFVADWKSGEPRVCEPDKVERWEWFSLDALPSPLFIGEREAVEAFHAAKILLFEH